MFPLASPVSAAAAPPVTSGPVTTTPHRCDASTVHTGGGQRGGESHSLLPVTKWLPAPHGEPALAETLLCIRMPWSSALVHRGVFCATFTKTQFDLCPWLVDFAFLSVGQVEKRIGTDLPPAGSGCAKRLPTLATTSTNFCPCAKIVPLQPSGDRRALVFGVVAFPPPSPTRVRIARRIT